MNFLEAMRCEIKRVRSWKVSGQVISVQGTLVQISGMCRFLSIGDRCYINRRQYKNLLCEVIGIDGSNTLVMPFGRMEGVGAGDSVVAEMAQPAIYPNDQWLGRVIDAFGNPLDEKGFLPIGDEAHLIHAEAPPAHQRRRLGEKIGLGVRAIDSFASCCIGQRMGIFAGSGVGKSVLLSMIARFSEADIIIVGLIGERGREVREFLEENLGEEGLRRSVVVVATSNESALTRRQAAYTTLTVAEYFRDKGFNVLCLMDSITRFAMAIREISLTAGEPPSNKGYTPSVFAEMPKLLERAGPGKKNQGNITGLFTVLVEGDDHNEPIADAVRSILDGHIVLDRAIAQRNRLPAVDILKSISRTLPGCNTEEENKIIDYARTLFSNYIHMEELIKLGTYQKGSDENTDRAIQYYDVIERFLSQKPHENAPSMENYRLLERILDLQKPEPAPPKAEIKKDAKTTAPLPAHSHFSAAAVQTISDIENIDTKAEETLETPNHP